MVEFQTGYTSAMDRIEQPIKPMEDVTAPDVERPIIPIGEIGTTAIDAGNILQNVENYIRLGTKKIQLVISGSLGQAGGISSGPSSWGKDVRTALREKAKATGVQLAGIEISPQILQGLSGSDGRGGINEEQRQQQMKLVRDSIRFAADVCQGGGVDLWSQEFNRNIIDAKWNREGKYAGQFYDHSQDELSRKPDERSNIVKYLIDKRDGRPMQGSQVRIGDEIREVKYQTAKDYEELYGVKGLVGTTDKKGRMRTAESKVDMEGNVVDENKEDEFAKLVPLIDPKTRELQTRVVKWSELEKRKDAYNQARGLKGDDALTTEEFLYRRRIANQKAEIEGRSFYYSRDLDRHRQTLVELYKYRDTTAELEKNMNQEQREEFIRQMDEFKRGQLTEFERARLLKMRPSEVIQDQIGRQQLAIRSEEEQAASLAVQGKEFDEMLNSITTPEKYAREKTFDSYAEMGVDAMNVTKERGFDDPKKGKPLYVGPEIGFANQMYGGHPEEFKELILESRKRMVEKLKSQGYDEDVAKEKAKTHIKGMLDTSHMMMWYRHFKRNPGESDDAHIKRFNGWLKENTKSLVEAGVVGGVQVVDTITGDHAHLPAGQGAFDVVGMVQAMKEAGFKGDIISEGHSEDTAGLGTGRILTETWRAFGSPIRGVAPGQRMGLGSWGGMHHAYFGHTRPVNYVVGAYSPGNDWTLWSETPFE